MTPRRIVLGRRARREAAEAASWYEGESPALGRAFLALVDTVLDRVTENPQQFPVVHRDIRRALLKRFPYGIFYSIEPNRIVVFAIMHARRDPAQWQRRIDPTP